MIDFGKIENIEKTLYVVNKDLLLKNVVRVSKEGYNGNRISSITAKEYSSKKYINADKLVNLNIDSNEYLVLTCKGSNKVNNGQYEYYPTENIFLSYPHIYNLLKGFQYIRNLIKKDKSKPVSERIYSKINGELLINEKYDDYMYTIDGLINDKKIAIIFDVIAKEIVEDQPPEYSKAVTIAFNSPEFKTTLSMDSFDSLLYFLKGFNLLQSSQALVQIAYMSALSDKLNISDNIIERYNTSDVEIISETKSDNYSQQMISGKILKKKR